MKRLTAIRIMLIANLIAVADLVVRVVESFADPTGMDTGMIPTRSFPYDLMAVVALWAVLLAAWGNVVPLICIGLPMIAIWVLKVQNVVDTGRSPGHEWFTLVTWLVVVAAALRVRLKPADGPPGPW